MRNSLESGGTESFFDREFDKSRQTIDSRLQHTSDGWFAMRGVGQSAATDCPGTCCAVR
jgi:hypothetical protein